MIDRLTILQGDCMDRLRELQDESVQCCVTSPPYWGLRDYGTARWDGGDANCEHVKATAQYASNATDRITSGPTRGGAQPHDRWDVKYRDVCGKCGAKRVDAQLGLEKTPEDYARNIVEVFREVRRVLAGDGTCWINLGDSYAGSWGAQSRGDFTPGTLEGASSREVCLSARQIKAHPKGTLTGSVKNTPGLKPKDLVGIPWMVAFAIRADGWYLRSDIIWHKPNPMPESVTDRPTKSHEYLFLLTKNQRYYYDHEAIQEPVTEGTVERYEYAFGGKKSEALIRANETGIGQRTRVVGERKLRTRQRPNGLSQVAAKLTPIGCDSGCGVSEDGLRNKRSVWTVTTQPYPDAHFATYPPDLIKPCILAGSKPGDTILDPFAGSGTTGMVALELGRKAVLIELNPEYCKLIERRCDVTPGFAL